MHHLAGKKVSHISMTLHKGKVYKCNSYAIIDTSFGGLSQSPYETFMQGEEPKSCFLYDTSVQTQNIKGHWQNN